MVTWELHRESGSGDVWNALLLETGDPNVFQTYEWGEFKRVAGWTPDRWLAREPDGSVVGMAQVLTKVFPGGISIGWAPGGPILVFPKRSGPDPTITLTRFLETQKATGARRWVRLYSLAPAEKDLIRAFEHACVRPLFALNSGYTLRIDLHQSLDDLTRKMSTKHRYYVKKSLGVGIEWKVGNDPELINEFSRLYADMVRIKALASLDGGAEEVRPLCAALGEQVIILAGFVGGEAVTACLTLIFGERAFYFKAATGRKGREMSAAYAMIHQLLVYLGERRVTQLDFGGIAPDSRRLAGVNHFKKGFGGELVEYVGEWEWASSAWLRWAGNLAIRCRRGLL